MKRSWFASTVAVAWLLAGTSFAQGKAPPPRTRSGPVPPTGAKPAPSPKPADATSRPGETTEPAAPAPPTTPPTKGATEEPAAPSPDADAVATHNTNTRWASLGFGPSVGIVGCVRRLCNLEQSYTQFKITEDFGYHVSGSDGFALGASLQEAFNSDFFRITAAFKMWWDAPISDELALYLTPMMHVGYAFQYFDFGELGALVDHALNVQAGLEMRLVLVDRAIMYVRPITADVNVGPDGIALFYDIAVGGGITFTP